MYTRIGIAQLEEIANHLRWTCDPRLKDKYKEVDVARNLLDNIKKLLFDMEPNASFGIHHPEVPERYREAYDLRQVVRHELYKQRNDPNVDRFSVDAYEPSQSAKEQPLAKIEVTDQVDDAGK